MIEGQTIICFASGYDAPPTSKHHVMHLLAERNVVIWVNYHASRVPSVSGSDMLYMARKLKQVFLHGVTNPRENLYVVTPLVVPLPGSSLARAVNRFLLVSRVRMVLGRVRRGPVQVWSFTPDVGYLLGSFGEQKVVYYCVDDFAHFTGYDIEQVRRDEADLCRRADLVITTSHSLQRDKAPMNPNTVMVSHGVEYDRFVQAIERELPEPVDLRDVPHPRFGFFGLIRDWVDLDLCREVARVRPDWHFVMIGDATFDLSPYRQLPNMHFLGRKPYDTLPAYCRYLDVGLIPFKINELTEAVNPIKLREYLAAGLPVIGTELPEVVESGYKGVYLCRDVESFVEAGEDALGRGLKESSKERTLWRRRQRYAEAMAEEVWPRKLEKIEANLDPKP